MKTLLSFVSASVLAVSFSFAQVPGIPGLSRAPVASGPQGTTLGANTTSGAGGIDLANRVKLRGYVDFMYANHQNEASVVAPNTNDEAGFSTAVDVDFLFDFSPVTAEVHTRIGKTVSGNIGDDPDLLEQAFIRYNVNRDFNISMGRQLTTLGFEGDEAPNLYQVSNAYLFSDGTSTASLGIPSLRRNYVDGIRGNFNNGRFGFSLGLHNALFDDDGSTKSGDVAVDLQAAIMILPGLEGRLGYAHDSKDDNDPATQDDIEQFNAWLAYNDRALTLAIEYDNWDIGDDDAWDVMLMGNYQFNDFFGLTLRYSHEDFDKLAESDRITLYTSFTVTDNLSLGLEYSHASVDQHIGADYDVDEFYAESLLSF